MRLENKVTVVTGAADGIGLSISQHFAREGAKVIMSDINELKCKKESELLNKEGYTTQAIKCSVGSSKEVKEMLDKTINLFGRLDVLVNNAAVALGKNIIEMSDEDWDELMNVNLKGVYRGVKYVLPYMLSQRGGSIINISSVQAIRSWDNWTAYAASKGAINAMTTQLAGQFGADNIRVNAISPGAIMTPLNQRRIENEGDAFLKASVDQSAMLRMGAAEEIAQTAVFLASDEARFITGSNIIVDGGLSTLPRYFEK